MHDTLCGQAAHSAINPLRGTQGMTLMRFLPTRGGRLGAASGGLLKLCIVGNDDSRSERGNLDAFFTTVSQTAVLTISDIDGFAAQGGMAGFSTTEVGVNIEINSGASKRAGLDIGAQLLQRATLVADARSDVKP